jgi:hypothetical protein
MEIIITFILDLINNFLLLITPFIGVITGHQIKEFGEKLTEIAYESGKTVGAAVLTCFALGLFFITVGYIAGELDGSNEQEAQEQADRDEAERVAAEQDERLRSYEIKEE